MTAFLISVVTNRVFFILRGDPLHDDRGGLTLRDLDYAYESPYINWTSPYFKQSKYECMLAPYWYDNRVPCNNNDSNPVRDIILFNYKYKIKYLHHLNDYINPIKDQDLRNWENATNQALFITNNRGHTLMALENPYINHTLVNEMGMTKHTLFPCLYHYLFRMKADVCSSGCRQTEQALLQLSHEVNPHTITVGIHTRYGKGEGHFYCAEDLIADYKTRNITVYILYLSAKSDIQHHHKLKYGDKLLLPEGRPDGVETVHDEYNGPHRNDYKAMRQSARDFHLFALTDIQIVSAESGFGVISTMTKISDRHRVYRVHGSEKRQCSILPGDSPEFVSAGWSGLRNR